MPLFFQVLASGSKGNAVLVCSPKTCVLLDAGLSGKELSRRLEKTPVNGAKLSGVVVSHEHQDHVRGCGVLSRRFDLPVYSSQGTLETLPPQVGQLASVQVFQSGVSFRIGDLVFHPFAISHDAKEPVGFIIEHQDTRLGVCTDLGVATQLVRTRLQGCHGLVLEANHDVDLLINGPYPWHLKQRIRSRHGHLSNMDTLELLKTIHHSRLKAVIFAHLSEVNNHPDKVCESVSEIRRSPQWECVRFEIGKQSEVGPGIELD
jgi:phosphoribosyl 1,2-cyclic phosphodiesterase